MGHVKFTTFKSNSDILLRTKLGYEHVIPHLLTQITKEFGW